MIVVVVGLAAPVPVVLAGGQGGGTSAGGVGQRGEVEWERVMSERDGESERD